MESPLEMDARDEAQMYADMMEKLRRLQHMLTVYNEVVISQPRDADCWAVKQPLRPPLHSATLEGVLQGAWTQAIDDRN